LAGIEKTEFDGKQTGNDLLLHLGERNCRGRLVWAQHAVELREEIEGLLKQGLVDGEFYEERLTHFDFRVPDGAESLIVVAVPRPQSQALFRFGGKLRALILPPTYVAYERTRKWVEDLLTGCLRDKGYRVWRALLPLKLLAARSGLCRYGRNNVCYVEGLGSFFELVAFCSDLPCEEDEWQRPQMMVRCESCDACRRNCPSGAIGSDRFLLHAERCIVFHNEKRGNVPFADWIDVSWHNCLFGCMRCQSVCPENRKFMGWIGEREEFSEDETKLLLRGVSRGELPAETVRKLENLDLFEDLDILPRNLSVFFGKTGGT
jgi:epoxyqueuosine reductase